ncbi:MAG TPA: GGDEF domain-containing protein [Patescibacteria group bacterium]|nr:GGDEF domain-containing protein [Patescibacteria group bacterium]
MTTQTIRTTPEQMPNTPETHAHALAMDEGFELRQKDENGLYKNGDFRRIAAQKVLAAKSAGVPVSAVIGDVDGLKYANDTYGHEVGDEVLGGTGKALNEIVEEHAEETPIMAARIGGDEFILLVFGDEDAAYLIAEELDEKHRNFLDNFENNELKNKGVGLSMGTASLTKEMANLSDLMKKADQEMYKNKEAKLGELNRRKKLSLIAARGVLKLGGMRLRDAPKLWRRMGIID